MTSTSYQSRLGRPVKPFWSTWTLVPQICGSSLPHSTYSAQYLASWIYSADTPFGDGRSNHSYYDPSKSTTSKKLGGYSYNITYGDGSSSSGDVYTDVVEFGRVKFSTQSVEAAKFVSSDFLPDPYFDGYFGIGHDSGNQGKLSRLVSQPCPPFASIRLHLTDPEQSNLLPRSLSSPTSPPL